MPTTPPPGFAIPEKEPGRTNAMTIDRLLAVLRDAAIIALVVVWLIQNL